MGPKISFGLSVHDLNTRVLAADSLSAAVGQSRCRLLSLNVTPEEIVSFLRSALHRANACFLLRRLCDTYFMYNTILFEVTSKYLNLLS